METALGVVAGKDGADVLDFLGFAVKREVSDECRPAVNPMVKGWLYSLNPAFMKSSYSEDTAYDAWVADQKRKLGDNLSLTPIPAAELAGIDDLFALVEGAKQLAEDKETAAEEALAAKTAAEAEAKAFAPFKKKAEELEKKLGQSEEKANALAAQVKELQAKLAAYTGKVAVDEADLEKSVKDIVAKAVKAALSGLVAAGGAAIDSAASDEPAAVDAASDTASSDVPDTFGFGTSGPSNDGFGF
jgi:hypothetical protein